MSTLICGSIAFDSIMVFRGRFKDHILPEQVHILNVAFLVPQLRREYGGTAGNIAYSLKLLGGDPLPMATVGSDSAAYLQRLEVLGIPRTHLYEVTDSFTAQAFITTDLDDNQITAFHPGAMSQSHLTRVPGDGSVRLGIVAPDGREGMIDHAAQFAENGIPFIFDPGQGLPMFDAADLENFMDQATYAVFNDYEAQLVVDRTGRPIEALARKVGALIVTRGGKGSDIFVDGRVVHIPVARTLRLVDPTGCGDAYRAGLLYGLANGMDWETTGRLAATMGALKIEHSGAQNHVPSRDEIADRFGESFGFRPW
ncbi:MAG: carbohydrate kinase family protein [Burkholderiales bacterium]|jgi:adenosine kinase|nr:carbohydrate kinase family protein [Burkholderiales bacterium]